WSFYDVGPADDVRLEVAAIMNKFQPNDIGRCGEPFTALVACNKTLGLWAHGLTGFALAGEERPPDPWEDIKGLQSGARLEFRLGRFSFQISNFWGYDQLPYAQQITAYERTVDPNTGRPRKSGAFGPCVTGVEPSCLPIVSNILPNGTTNPAVDGGSVVNPAAEGPTRDNQPLNQQLFAMICATSIGFHSLDRSACGQTLFNSLHHPLNGVPFPRSQAKDPGIITISSFLSNSLAGNAAAAGIVGFLAGAPPPFVPLNVDPCDGFTTGGCPAKGQAPVPDYGPTPAFA